MLRLFVTGSHNSFTGRLEKYGDLDTEYPQWLNDLLNNWMKLEDIAKEKIYNWSKTQDTSFTDQLRIGVRYFDLRISVRNGDFYLSHTLYAQRVQDAFTEIKSFLNCHPTEVILLDINHLYGFDSATTHEKLVSVIRQVFGNELCPYQNIFQVTLEHIWSQKQQVLVFYHDSDTTARHHFLWPASNITSPWPNLSNENDLLRYLNDRLWLGRNNDIFYVTQAVLTPDADFILTHYEGSLKQDMSLSSRFLSWLQSKHSGYDGINVFIMDFINESYTASVIELNKYYYLK